MNDGGPITASTRGTSTTTVGVAAPTIDTSLRDLAIGGALSDQVRLGPRQPQAGATIDFRAFGPDDATCSGAAVFESLVSGTRKRVES